MRYFFFIFFFIFATRTSPMYNALEHVNIRQISRYLAFLIAYFYSRVKLKSNEKVDS